MRSTTLWRGKTDDAKVPPRVRLRIFERCKGICHLSGRKIVPGDAWDLDHIVALCNGGTHSEDNLAPALRDKHRAKTARDVAEKARTNSVARKHYGVKRSSRPMPGSRASGMRKRMDGTVERRS